MTPRPYQADLIHRTESAFLAGARRVLQVLPTGGGKTVCFAEAARIRSQRYGEPVLVVAHRRELIRQAADKLRAAGVEPGVIAPGSRGIPAERVHVASIQTLANRLDRLPTYGRIILDEAHHATAGQWLRLLDAQRKARVQGTTATPERLDGTGLGDVFDTLIEGPSAADLIAGGYLTPVRVFGAAEPPNLKGVRTLGGDWNAADLVGALDVPKITGDVADEYFWHCSGRPAIAFCASVAHADQTAGLLAAQGWRAYSVDGGTHKDERDRRIAGLADGSTEILCTCDLISEGLDVPAVFGVILLRPTKSLGLFLQQVGRGLRPAPGKDHLIVLDHAGNTLQHGMPTEPRKWSLDARKRKETAPAIRQCASCYMIFAPAPCCPGCGESAVSASARGARKLHETTEGALVELSPEDRRLRETPLRQLIKEAKGYAALKAIQVARGLPDGQAQKWLENKNRYRGWKSGVAI